MSDLSSSTRPTNDKEQEKAPKTTENNCDAQQKNYFPDEQNNITAFQIMNKAQSIWSWNVNHWSLPQNRKATLEFTNDKKHD